MSEAIKRLRIRLAELQEPLDPLEYPGEFKRLASDQQNVLAAPSPQPRGTE